jgi:hypothetical protein
MSTETANKFLQTDQIALSCLLQKAQKPRQYALAAEEKSYTAQAAFREAFAMFAVDPNGNRRQGFLKTTNRRYQR